MSSIKNQSSNDDLEEARRRQVDELQGIIKSEVDKVLDREGKLSQLEKRADRLQEETEQSFHRTTTSPRKKRKKRKKCNVL